MYWAVLVPNSSFICFLRMCGQGRYLLPAQRVLYIYLIYLLLLLLLIDFFIIIIITYLFIYYYYP